MTTSAASKTKKKSTSKKESATDKRELTTLLKTKAWYAQLPKKVVSDFTKTIKYTTGHLAHMKQDPIRQILSKKDFTDFLTVVGTTPAKFKKYDARFCAGGTQYRYCSPGSGYCDPSWCHAN
jgi:hypothetical protein